MTLWLLLCFYAAIGFAFSFSLFLRVRITLDAACGRSIHKKYWGQFLRLASVGFLCFLIFNYKSQNLVLGLSICLITAVFTLMYFLYKGSL